MTIFVLGVPGVKPERFAEGFSIQHCALSLVGEPIMYPDINQFIEMLHERVRKVFFAYRLLFNFYIVAAKLTKQCSLTLSYTVI